MLRRMVYEHPVYTPASVAAQRRLPALNTAPRTAFAGAYHGWGFHEDGCAPGVRAAAAFGVRAGDAVRPRRSTRAGSVHTRRDAACAHLLPLRRLHVAGRPRRRRRRPAVRPAGCRRCGRRRGSTPPTTSATRPGSIRDNVVAFARPHGVDVARRA